MRKLKNGDVVYITGNVVIRRSNGKLERLHGSKATIISAGRDSYVCDVGIGKPVALPKKNLLAA